MSDIWTYTICRTKDLDKKNHRTEFSCADRVTKKSRWKHDGDARMTEKELLQQIKYHKAIRDHNDNMSKHYQKRLRQLREAVAQKTSATVTNNIIEKLKK